jgi:tRNA dimethylallyltransferase
VSVPPVLALVGPTAAGKSALALDAAARLGAEVVAVDAFTIYRGMDVGTAKPTPEERVRVRHHLLDVLEPEEEASVAWFQATAREAIAEIRERGRIPLLVGGSGLYFRAIVDPLEFPPTDVALRQRLQTRWEGDPAAAHALLTDRDPAAAALIEPGNLRRSVRALEVLELTGRPFSDWRRAWDSYTSVYDPLCVIGVGVDREELARRIDARVDAMVARGLIAECRRLVRRPLSPTARQAIGYAEVFDALEGRTSLEDAIERTKIRTRRYAVRQQRWFAADPRVRWRLPTQIPEELIACAS